VTNYVTTKEECEKNIKGVCEGCGGPLSAIETVDNARNPTYWQGCEHCSCFRAGIDSKYFKVARRLVDEGKLVPYGRMREVEYNAHGHREYYLDTQTAGLSHTIQYIDNLLKEEVPDVA
jgi:hypothetical protein